MKVKAGQVLRCAPFQHIKVDKTQDSAISIKYKIVCFLPLGCVQIVIAGSPGLVALL